MSMAPPMRDRTNDSTSRARHAAHIRALTILFLFLIRFIIQRNSQRPGFPDTQRLPIAPSGHLSPLPHASAGPRTPNVRAHPTTLPLPPLKRHNTSDHAVTFAVECAQRTDWKLIDRSVRVHPPPHWRGQSAQSLRQCHTSVPRYLRFIISHPKCPAPDDRGGESPQSGGHPPQSHPSRFQISPRHRFTALNFLSMLRLRVALRPRSRITGGCSRGLSPSANRLSHQSTSRIHPV